MALAHINDQPLDQLAAAMWKSLGMPEVMYGPLNRSSRVAPTERRIPGAPRIRGAAHDDNAALLGGVAGHAGVFATPHSLAQYAQRLLTACADETDADLGEWMRASLVPQIAIEPGLDRGLSWILAAGGRVAYHHGFTGTSLYLAPTPAATWRSARTPCTTATPAPGSLHCAPSHSRRPPPPDQGSEAGRRQVRTVRKPGSAAPLP